MAESVPHEVSTGHDDHHDHHDPSFFEKYMFSTDHKMIAMQYMFTGMAMGLIGAFMAYAFRMQLAFPGESVPGFGLVTPANYNASIVSRIRSFCSVRSC